MMKVAGPSSKLMQAISVAFALSGMIISRGIMGANATATITGLIGFALFAALYCWAEEVSKRPRFLWIPLFWLFCGLGLKGEGLILGLPIHLILSLSFRKFYENQNESPKEDLEATGADVCEKDQ